MPTNARTCFAVTALAAASGITTGADELVAAAGVGALVGATVKATAAAVFTKAVPMSVAVTAASCTA